MTNKRKLELNPQKLNAEDQDPTFQKLLSRVSSRTILVNGIGFVFLLFLVLFAIHFDETWELIASVFLLALWIVSAATFYQNSFKRVEFYEEGMILVPHLNKSKIRIAYDDLDEVRIISTKRLRNTRVDIYFHSTQLDNPIIVNGSIFSEEMINIIDTMKDEFSV